MIFFIIESLAMEFVVPVGVVMSFSRWVDDLIWDSTSSSDFSFSFGDVSLLPVVVEKSFSSI